MFKFESLEMIGFKSFADKTRLTFNDRATAIVGPNGCGKSNLADAIGWVLGVQAARHLRGQNMEDLIFNGSGKRRQSGVAEVTLTLRRTEAGRIEVAGESFEEDTLEISRKYYRSGEGYYLINERRSRLMDIHRFLEEAGLGFSSYAIIAQGKIDSFLTSKPLERRALIEEAARIAGYKSRRRSAELKLELAQQNLLRVNDIISEVERQLRSLKRQAAKARKYRRLKEEFRQVMRRNFALEAERLNGRLGELDSRLEQFRIAEQEAAGQLFHLETEAQQAAERREALEAELSALLQKRSEVRLALDRTQNSISYQNEQMDSTRLYLEQNSAEKDSILQALEQIAGEVSEFAGEKRKLASREAEISAQLDAQKGRVEEFRRKVDDTEKDLEDLRTARIGLAADRAALQNQMEQLQERQRLDQATRSRLDKEAGFYDRKLAELRVSVTAQESRREQMQLEETELKDRIESESERRRQLQQEVAQLEEEYRGLQNQLIAFRERLQSLQEVELTRSNYSQGVQAVLKHLAGSSDLKTAGTLADFLDTSPQFERLVEEFLDEELEYILVDSLEEAARGLSQLRSLKSGRCTFLSLYTSNGFGKERKERGLPQSPEEGLYGRLADLIDMTPEVAEAFRRVLPERAEALVVSDVDRAFQLAHSYPESTFITLQGEALTPRGLLSATAPETKNLGLLGLKRQKRELEKKIADRQRRLDSVKAQWDTRKAELDAITSLWEENRAQLYRIEKECIGLGHEHDRLKAEIAHQQKAAEVVAAEREQLSEQRAQQQEKLVELRGRLKECEGSSRRLEEQRLQKQENLEELRQAFAELQDQFNGLVSDQKVIQERLAALDRTMNRIRSEEERLQSRLRTKQEDEQQSRRRIQEMTEKLEELGRKLKRDQRESELLEAAFAEKKTALDRFKTDCQELEQKLAELRRNRSECQESRSTCEVERARLETQLQNLQEQCFQQLRFPLREAVADVETSELDAEEVQARRQELQARLESFGPVNMTALQEYQENEERFQFLTGQRRDLEQSIADTTSAIQEINRRSRQKFSEAFATINANFKEVFQKLFGGGDCGMQLQEGEDVLECGIDVFAQPPGKKLQNVMLLSGGEKAMTVFALLIGIFLFRPSRFCVLDEVDAPLDDANVRRFGTLIREMSEQTQFIIVTHNKRTMELADSLFGVTMEEAGVSKVVSVKF